MVYKCVLIILIFTPFMRAKRERFFLFKKKESSNLEKIISIHSKLLLKLIITIANLINLL